MIVLKAAQEKVLSALQSVGGIVERRHTLPILANVLIRKTGAKVEMTTSDLEIQVRTSAQLDGDDGDFAITVGAKKLMDILKSLPVTKRCPDSQPDQVDLARRQKPFHAADAAC